jgi:pimeloyl-ACP methyl ester carboxylesterase
VLDALGIARLYCIAGPSMGSLHTLCFAAMYPERVERAIAVATAARMTASGMAMHHFLGPPGLRAGDRSTRRIYLCVAGGTPINVA